ncbi:MAG: serine protein kinase RIO [Candidatus Bathyarchaeota archaeon]|nr:serine protein kinase RIO [Candidatus Bathyarchaeota archaeon]
MSGRRRRSKVLEKLKRREQRYERERRMLEKDLSSERAVLEEVFDRSTLMTIYYLMNKGIIDEIYGSVKAGKESKLYWGKDKEGNNLAIKIFLTVSAEFKKGMLVYIQGDPRFTRVRRDTRSLIYLWAQKEFKNLHSAYEVGVRVPKPITVRRNVLIMEFIGENGISAPLLREIQIKNPDRTYRQILANAKRLYRKAGLVHADLSEYNVMIWKEKPVLFDVSQAVSREHPMASEFLRRDLENISRYFKRLGVAVPPIEELFKKVAGNVKS